MTLNHKYLLILFVVLFGLQFTLSSQTEDPLIKEVQITNGDSLYRHLYIYNDVNTKTMDTKYVKIGKSWFRREQTEWFYSLGLCTEQYVRVWENEKWNLKHLIRFEYENRKISSETHFNINDNLEEPLTKIDYVFSEEILVKKNASTFENNAWRLDLKVEYSYNPNSKLDIINYKKYKNGILFEEERVKYTYNNFQEIDSILTEKKENNLWRKTALLIYIYSPVSQLKTTEISKEWDSIYNIWNNVQMVEYKYNISNQLTEENYMYWSSAFWKNDLKYSYQYNPEKFLVKKTTFLPIYNDYRQVSSINYFNFEYNRANTIEAKYEFWGGEIGDSINTFIPYLFNNDMVINYGSKINISYIPVYDTENLNLEKNNTIKVYPNPSKAIFYFKSENYDVNKWIVTDLNGRTLITNDQSQKSGAIDLGDFKPGIYMLQIITPDGVKVQKLIKEAN